jgi:NAD(P)-dependent dehydrogenase (short-subunit alcohol dehydrogenase family)
LLHVKCCAIVEQLLLQIAEVNKTMSDVESSGPAQQWINRLPKHYLAGKQFLVTGASGLGYHAAHGLAAMDASVVLVGRDRWKLNKRCQELNKVGEGTVTFEEANFAALLSTHIAARNIRENYPRIDGLILNAGIYGAEEASITPTVNVLSALVMANALRDNLPNNPASRIVMVGSSGEHFALGNFNPEGGRGPKFNRYNLSKLALHAIALKLQQNYEAGKSDIRVITAEPGATSTNLMDGHGLLARLIARQAAKNPGPERAVHSILYAAIDPKAPAGGFIGPNSQGQPIAKTPARRLRDQEFIDRVWDDSMKAIAPSFNIVPTTPPTP